ncbi:MAG: branched-chain amino acid ABC transporter substrate-binding protein [Deltaproteobacteria bacterium]|nr:MAG: branched-chain amino acid ABC transporter substrate-binding protein [Deltaproteobacteria bacterium]
MAGPARVAVVAPGTGLLREEGTMLRLGALMALQEVRQQEPGLQVEVVVQESQCSAQGAVPIARRLAADASVRAVVGYLCAEAVGAVLPIYREANLAIVNPTISAEYLQKDERSNLFPLLYGDGEQAAFLAAYIRTGLGYSRTAVLSDGSAYGRVLEDAFLLEAEEQGLEMVANVALGLSAVDAARAVQLLLAARPEAIFLATNTEAARLFLLEKYRQQLGGEVLGSDRLATMEFYEMVGQAAEGLLMCQPVLFGEDSEETGRFARKFEHIHKRRPDWIAAGGYDAMRLVLEVLKRSGADRSGTLQALEAISGPEKAFGALSGPVYFTEDGTSRRPIYVGTVRRGSFRAASPPTVEFLSPPNLLRRHLDRASGSSQAVGR